MPRKRSAPAPASAGLSAKDVRAYIREKAATIAPADLEELLSRANDLLERASGERYHVRLRRQTEMALQILSDHDTGEASQIPYFTISVLAVALFYFLKPDDVVPDFLPVIGSADDALVVELAFEMGAAGVTRYCDWRGLASEDVLPAGRRA